MEYLILVIGLVALIKGADLFVSGSSNIARKFSIPPIIVGLTIVSLGTSLPEAAVSVTAAIGGRNNLSLGNITGSNLFNLLIVVGICSIINTLKSNKDLVRRDFPAATISAVLLLVFALDGMLSRFDGIIMLVLCFGYIGYLIKDAYKTKEFFDDSMGTPPVFRSIVFIVIGASAIIIGGQLVVDSAVEIATALGMSEAIIGLTVLAIGTSLPELVTSAVAAMRGENEIALGNAVGSNILNILFILGISSAITPIAVTSLTNIIFVIIATLLVYFFVLTSRKMKPIEGVITVVVYIGYIAYAIITR